MSKKEGITRRDFTKSAIVGVGAAVGMGASALVGFSPKEAKAGETDVKWDKEADVVVLGTGCAGETACLAAHDAGAKVLVLEAQSIPGGTTRASGGCTWIPNNPVMREAGIKDSREEALTYCRLLAQGQADDELIVTFVDKSLEMLEYIMKHTPLEKWDVNGFPDYHPEWSGGKRKGRSINAAKYKGKTWGATLAEGLYDAAKERGIEFMFNTRGKKLITNATGEVIGIQAFTGVKWIDSDYSGGASINIKARKGVILTTGGFEWNQQMVKHYLRGPQTSTVNLPVGQGDSLIMALSVGADVRNLNECWGLPIYMASGWEDEVKAYQPEKYDAFNLTNFSAWDKLIADWFIWRGKPGMITVNKYGKRFCNEGADYDTTWRSFLTFDNFGATGYPNIPGYVIIDSTAWNKHGIAGVKAGSIPPDWIKKANTLKELAKKLGIDPDGLERTVINFNSHARQGKDPEFHRGESFFDRFHALVFTEAAPEDFEDPAAALAPLEIPPFYGVETWPGSCGTCGGPRVNKDAQVVNPFGKAIPGLYAAGNAAGVGAPGASYGAPGGTIGPGMTFGYLAGLHAAKR